MRRTLFANRAVGDGEGVSCESLEVPRGNPHVDEEGCGPRVRLRRGHHAARLLGLNATMFKEYLRFIANRRCQQINDSTHVKGAYVKDIRLDSRTGALTIVLAAIAPHLEGKSFQWVPSGQPDAIVWPCRNIDVPPKFLPSICRN